MFTGFFRTETIAVIDQEQAELTKGASQGPTLAQQTFKMARPQLGLGFGGWTRPRGFPTFCRFRSCFLTPQLCFLPFFFFFFFFF